MKVKFSNVGRDKKTWVKDFPGDELVDELLYRAVRPYLNSRSIEFTYDEETNRGLVWVGSVRAVGEFCVMDD